MVLHPPQIFEKLRYKTLFLDTNVFSTAFRYEELTNFLLDLRENDCALVTIPSVLFEVTRGSATLSVYNERAEALKSLVTYTDPMAFANQLDAFSVVMAKLLKPERSQYTDFLLSACLFKYRASGEVLLMTSDIQSLPSSILIVSTSSLRKNRSEIRNFGIFRLNDAHYERASAELLT